MLIHDEHFGFVMVDEWWLLMANTGLPWLVTVDTDSGWANGFQALRISVYFAATDHWCHSIVSIEMCPETVPHKPVSPAGCVIGSSYWINGNY